MFCRAELGAGCRVDERCGDGVPNAIRRWSDLAVVKGEEYGDGGDADDITWVGCSGCIFGSALKVVPSIAT